MNNCGYIIDLDLVEDCQMKKVSISQFVIISFVYIDKLKENELVIDYWMGCSIRLELDEADDEAGRIQWRELSASCAGQEEVVVCWWKSCVTSGLMNMSAG